MVLRSARSVLARTGLENFRVGSFSVRRAKGRALEAVARVLAFVYRGPAMVSGHRMYLSAGPGDFSVDMFVGAFEEGTTEVFERSLRAGMCVVDLGAHIGYFTLLAARLVGPTGKVYAFEPTPETYRVLLKNIALNGYQNITAIQKAVADRTGRTTFQLSGAGTRSNSLYVDTRYDVGQTIVEVTTLDEFLERQGWPHVDLVKMDIEGAELAALAGMRRLLQRPGESPQLIIEFNPDSLTRNGMTSEEFFAKLREMGLRTRFIMESGLVESVDIGELSANLRGGCRVNLLCDRLTLSRV